MKAGFAIRLFETSVRKLSPRARIWSKSESPISFTFRGARSGRATC